jgi:ubiquinone biosynthesis protein Coq4
VKVALVPTKLVVVALVADRLVEVVLVATTVARLAVPVAVMLVPVAFPKRRLVMEARAADRKLVRKLPELTMLAEVVVPVRLIAFNWLIEVVETTPLTVDCIVLEAPPV